MVKETSLDTAKQKSIGKALGHFLKTKGQLQQCLVKKPRNLLWRQKQEADLRIAGFICELKRHFKLMEHLPDLLRWIVVIP